MPQAKTWRDLKPDDYDYRRISLHGHFDNAKEVLVFRTDGPRDLGPGYLVLTPLILASGGQAVIVNRGYVPTALAAKSTPPEQRNRRRDDGDGDDAAAATA